MRLHGSILKSKNKADGWEFLAFASLAVLGHGEVINSRPLGFVVKQAEGMPAHRRVGTILTRFSTHDEFCYACQTSSDWIRVNFC